MKNYFIILCLTFSSNLFAQHTVIETVNKVKFEMVFVEGGSFEMGSNEGEKGEKPVHQVSLNSFLIGKYEVTQELWVAVMEVNPSKFKGKNLPVENVSWKEAQKFIKKLNRMTAKKYRLPIEAEWEYAAKGGQKSQNYTYAGTNTEDKLYQYANFCDTNCTYDWIDKSQNDGYQHTAAVGSFLPNDLGIYDMSGNVWEWCQDNWHEDYQNAPSTGIAWKAKSNSARVHRGGGWYDEAKGCRLSHRGLNYSKNSSFILGFRLVVSHQ